ncbi:uncharacterized protein AC631_05950 [Debaryomyces fabryi]|uniref:CCHC-type domain-containing protein n=1 Tax=Debaryomyces fabryi TaxID=58627 RepID=A0A0V1PPW4_9ASCO|nr:uncharacterized protein AC631_05950 [Debaryomyces fabryi]KRZ98291.1 hypothetical protein AC631_05950 [Debaryomyces fabryi]
MSNNRHSPDHVLELINFMKAEAEERELRIFLLNAKVKSYNGTKNPTKIQEFIEEIIRISVGYKLLDQQLITLAGRNMTGIAERWFLEYREQKIDQTDTFDDFADRVRKQFAQGYDVQSIYNKLITCVQLGSVEQYNSRFSTLLLELPRNFLGEEAKVTAYINNLRSQLKPHVKLQRPSTLSEAIEYALVFETQYTELSWWEKKTPFSKNAFHRYQPQNNSDNMEIDSVKAKKKSKVCYNCGKEGHFATNCSNKSKN